MSHFHNHVLGGPGCKICNPCLTTEQIEQRIDDALSGIREAIEKELAMSVRCKVQVIRVGIPYHYPNLELMPVHADIEGSENSKFFNATPSGEIKLGVQNEAALAQFKPGDYFYVDFTPAPKE